MTRGQRLVLRRAQHLVVSMVVLTLAAGVVATASGRRAGTVLPWMLAALLAAALLRAWARWQRERLLREMPIPAFLKRKLREAHPALSGKDSDLVERGLRQFFFACLRSRGAFVAMPSRVVDTLWHEFIVHTRAYEEWCELTLGRFLHHTPAAALGPKAQGNDGLRRAWYWACRDEAIDPRRPTRLPLLFALDAKLGIDDGFHYVPDCRDIERKSRDGGGGDGGGGTYCGSDFSSNDFSGDAGGMGGSDAAEGGGDGGGDASGGDGGGGCGGGGD